MSNKWAVLLPVLPQLLHWSNKWKWIRVILQGHTYMWSKRGRAIKASVRTNYITGVIHLVHFTSRRKRENMWKFNDSKRNVVYRKGDVRDVINCSMSKKCHKHRMLKIKQKLCLNLSYFSEASVYITIWCWYCSSNLLSGLQKIE